jgi:hypothetical protein
VIRSARVRHPTASLDAASAAELKLLREWVASAAVETARI